MIGKAKAISHGINDLRYITGESRNKKHPELILHIADNLLPSHLDAQGIWQSIKLTQMRFKPVKNSLIRIELSPSPEHTQNFTPDDWRQLWNDFITEFDKMELFDKNGKTISSRTNLAGSKGTVWLHMESDSGIPHLHGAVCRIDNNGNINNDHNIHLRAQRAAEKIAQKRGWTTAAEIRDTNIEQVSRDCMDALRSMDKWSWEEYTDTLTRKGYDVRERRDSGGTLRGYVLQKGKKKYKASELGKGRNLMVSKLQNTWTKLHPSPTATDQITGQSQKKPPFDYKAYHPGTTPYTLNHNGESIRYYIPNEAMRIFEDEFDYRTVANNQELSDMAIAIFVGLLSVQSAPTGGSGGGGGNQSDLPWRDKDDDNSRWARRCALAAGKALGKKPKSKIKR